MSSSLRPWIENVALHPDVLSESFSEAIFALDLGPLADWIRAKEAGLKLEGVRPPAPVYLDPEQFFRSSYLTTGLRSLLSDVLEVASGRGANRVLKLVTAFGGGKSHTLAALMHAARNRKALDVVPEGRGLPDAGRVRVAVFDGQFFNAKTGKEAPGDGFIARTMWGWIAWSLAGKKGYELLREEDESCVAPGGDAILKLLKEGPNLILLDEVLEYLISSGGIRVEKTTLRDETITFIKHLTVAADNAKDTVVVLSLQSSKPREILDYISLFQTLDHVAARKDQRREPVEGNEILSVVQRRLLASMPDDEASAPTANEYQQVVTRMRRAYARSAAEQQQAEEEGLALRDRIRAAYPFHPALIDLMRERWAAIPDFQRTRGALRFLASCLRAAHRDGRSRLLLGPGDIPLQDSEVRQAFFKEVGQREDFQACLEHDFIGANARTRRIDDRRAKEVPAEAGKRPATRLATAILMYSFGGLRRDAGGAADVLPPGVTEAELLAACVGPDLDSTTAQACLKELREQCLYLHFDGARYCFKKDPNITLLVEQESDAIARDTGRVRARIKEMLEERLAGHRTARVWPEKSIDLDDKEPAFIVGYLPLEFGTRPGSTRESEALEFFEKCGSKPREFRNGLALAIPSADQIEILRRSVRYLMAIEQVRDKAKQLNLTDAQRDQLREREATERAAAESAFLKLYSEVWLPRTDNGGIAIDMVAVGGRPLETTLDERKRARVHDRVMELVTDTHRRVHLTLVPTKIVELFKLGDGAPPRMGIGLGEVIAGFYSFLGFTRLATEAVVRKAITAGVEKRVFAYTTGTPQLESDGRFKIDRSKIRYDIALADDEVDLQAGFLILPSALPLEGASDKGPQPPILGPPPVGPGPGSGDVPPPPGPPPPGGRREVALTFMANRDQLFTAWQALANLADMAGTVNLTVNATSDAGFDARKLENGVLEPLRETGLIK